MVICLVAGIIGILQRVDKRVVKPYWVLRGVEYVDNFSDCFIGRCVLQRNFKKQLTPPLLDFLTTVDPIMG